MSKEIEIEIGTHKLSIVAEDGKTPIKGVDFLTDKEIDEIKKEVTPIKNVDYFDGKDYVLTSADKKEIAKSIDVPIVKEKTIVEKTEVVHEVPVVKEVAVTDTPTEIAEKINTLDKQIDFKVLKNVPEFVGKGGSKLISARSGGVDSFTKLKDAPSSYSGQGSKVVKVKADETGLEFGVATSTDEKVKYDVNDSTAGYVADKFVAGTGITLSEGTGADENKLKITNSGVVTETDPLSIHNDLMTTVGDMIYENNLTFDTYTSNTATYLGFDYAASPIVVSENGIVSSAIITLNTFGSVAGNVYAKIYNWDATNKIPTGSALSTSDVVDASTVTGDTTFTFTGANKILLNSTSDYCLALYYDGVDFLVYRIGNTGLRDGPGYMATSSDGSTWTTTGGSLHFTLYGIKPDRLPIGTTGQVIKVAGGEPTWADETDPLSLHLDQTTPQTFTGGAVTGTGLLQVVGGVLGKNVMITVSETAPANPQMGDLWVDLTE
jgi:hypothetical protein